MDTIQAAHNILRSAEQGLETLVEDLVKERKYDDVTKIIELLKKVNSIMEGVSTPTMRIEPREPASQLKVSTSKGRRDKESKNRRPRREAPKQKPKRSAAPRTSKYPYFVKDLERLVKVGWSKKNGEEYEHRVPKPTVYALVSQLAERVKDHEVFEMESLGAFFDPEASEIPAYQAYVTLAWLRDIQAVEKKGRDGYLLRNRMSITSDLDTTWGNLQVKTTTTEA